MIFNDNTVEFSWDGRDYLWILSRVTWDAALQDANDRGGTLWSSETSNENAGVLSALGSKISGGVSTAFLGSQSDGVNYVWLGLNDKDTSGTWNWHSEETLSFENWASTATPTNNTTETVAALAVVIPDDVTTISTGEWNDFTETDVNTYIVENSQGAYALRDTTSSGSTVLPDVNLNLIDTSSNSTAISISSGNINIATDITITHVTLGSSSTHSYTSGVSLSDVGASLRHVVGMTTLTGQALQAADVDNNGSVSLTDVGAALRHVVGMSIINTFDLVNESGELVTSLGPSAGNLTLYLVENGDVSLDGAFVAIA